MDCWLTSLDNRYRMINSLAPVTSFEDRFRFRTGSSLKRSLPSGRRLVVHLPCRDLQVQIIKDPFSDLRICVDLSEGG